MKPIAFRILPLLLLVTAGAIGADTAPQVQALREIDGISGNRSRGA